MKKIITAIWGKLRPKTVIILEPLTAIEQSIFPVIMCPFNGKMLPFVLKELNEIETTKCGSFSLIEDIHNEAMSGVTPDIAKMLDFSEIQHNVCKASMINPTYEQVLALYDKNGTVNKTREELKEIELKLIQLELDGHIKEYRELYADFAAKMILCNFMLPNDFTSYVTYYALGVGKTDIKKVTDEMCLDAAKLAVNGGDNPHDHISGEFTKFNEKDIDKRAWFLLAEERNLKHGS